MYVHMWVSHAEYDRIHRIHNDIWYRMELNCEVSCYYRTLKKENVIILKIWIKYSNIKQKHHYYNIKILLILINVIHIIAILLRSFWLFRLFRLFRCSDYTLHLICIVKPWWPKSTFLFTIMMMSIAIMMIVIIITIIDVIAIVMILTVIHLYLSVITMLIPIISFVFIIISYSWFACCIHIEWSI